MVEAKKAEVNEEIEQKMAAYYAQQLVHPRTLFSYEKSNVICEGDVAIIYEKHDLLKQVVITKGQQYTA